MVGGPKFRQDAIKQLKLSRRTEQVRPKSQCKVLEMNKNFRAFVDRSMDKTLTLSQFHQYSRDAQKKIPV